MKFLAILAIAAVGLTSALAQRPGPQGGPPGGGRMGPPGARMAKMNEELFKQLNLTPDQKKRVMALEKSNGAKMKAAWDASKGDRSAMRDKMMAMRKDSEKTLATILKPDQLKKFKELRKAMMDKMRAQRGMMGGPGGKPPKP